MKIVLEKNVDAQEWDRQAGALGGGYFHCHAQATYDAACDGVEPLFIRAIGDDGQCQAVATGTLARSSVWPFSRYCGYAMLYSLPAIASPSLDAHRQFMEALHRRLRGEGVFSIHFYSYDLPASGDVLPALGYELAERNEFILDLSGGAENVWNRFRGQRRTDIRKAEKSSVVTRLETDPAAADLVFGFQVNSMRRRGVDLNSATDRVANARRQRQAGGTVDVFISYQNGVPINGSLFGSFGNRPYYLVSGSSDAGFKCCGPAHLVWTAIQTYVQRGATRLNLGAVLAGQEGLAKFKQDFGATPVAQPIGKKRISSIGSGLHRLRSALQGAARGRRNDPHSDSETS